MPSRLLPLLLLGVVLASAGCATCAGTSATSSSTTPAQQPSAAQPSAAADAAGRRLVTITDASVPMPEIAIAPMPAGTPTRIVSLATGVGETLAALGVGDRVVGRDETSSVPAIAGAVVVTKAHATSAERVLSLGPDLVIVDAATSPPEAIAQIRDTGVRVVEVPEAWSLSDIAPRTQAVAEAAGVPASVAAAVVSAATGSSDGASTDAASAIPSDAPRVAFLYLRGTSAVYLVGGAGSGADALITAAGGIDAGAAAGYEAFVPLTAEAVATLDPDVLLVMTKGLESVGGVDGLAGLPGVAQTRAGAEGRVVAVDDTLLLSFGPRTGELVDALRSAIAESAA